MLLLHLIYATYSVNDTLLWQDIYASYLLRQYSAYITIRVIVSPLIPQCWQVWITFVCGQWRQSGHINCRVQMSAYSYRHAAFDMCVCGAVYAFSCIFSLFSLSEHYYIVQYRCKKYVFVPSLPTALLLFCAFAVANLSACNTCSRYFSLHFLM